MEMTLPTMGGLTVTPHPLTLSGQRHIPCDLILGETLHSFLRRHVDDIDSGLWFVAINGYSVPPAMWDKTKPKHGTLVECRSHVHKGALQIAAIVAIAWFAPWAAGAMGFAAGTTAFAAVSAGITVAGSMIINKVLGPKQPGAQKDFSGSPTYSLQGGRNRSRPYEPIGLLFGEMRFTPDFASIPYPMFEGEDQYLYSVFHAGINCSSVSDLRIGKTPITDYAGVTTRADGISGLPQQALEGWGNVDSTNGAQLVYAPGGTPVTVARTGSVATVAIQIDLEASVYYISTKGDFRENPANVTGEYRLLPSGSWTPLFQEGDPFYLSPGVIRLKSSTTKPLRLTYTRYVAAGQYEVRLTKTDSDQQESSRANLVTWTQMRSIQVDGGQYGGMGRFGVKIKASGQLSGSLDEINWYGIAKPMPYWNGSTWVTATSRNNGLSNPGAQLLLWARGIWAVDPATGVNRLIAGIGLADSMIDIEGLQGFMVRCAAKGFTFDYMFDSMTSCQDVAEAIAAVGMGSPSWQSGKFGVVWAAEDQPIEGVVNMATMKARSFNVNYQTVETADGIEYAYFDRDRDYSWQTLRVTSPSVATTLNPARISSIGVTDMRHGAILARFHLAQSEFQRKDITFDTDLEHLTYKRSSVLALTHDVTQWGFGGRVQGAVDNSGYLTLTLDDDVPAGSGSRYIGLRIPGEGGYRVFGVAPFVGESRTVTLTTIWPVGVPVPGATAGNAAHDTIWIYDFKATPGYKVRVVGIQPESGMTGAKISVVPESAEFWDYVWNGAYSPPANQSLLPYGLPVVSNASLTEELQRQGNTFYTSLTVSFDVANAYRSAQVWGMTAGNVMQKLGETEGHAFTFRGGLDEVWTIEVRPFDGVGRAGTKAVLTHSVIGLREPPPNIVDLSISGAVLNWSAVDAADLAGYIFRFHYGSNLDWGSAVPLHVGVITQSPYDMVTRPSGAVTIMGKAIDTTGNESLATANVVTDLGDAPVANVVEVIDLSLDGFPGSVSGGALVSGELLATDVDSAYGTDNQSFYGADNDPAYELSTYAEMVYATNEIAIGSALTGSVMTMEITSAGTDLFIEYRLAGPESVYGADSDSAYGPDGESFYGAPGSWIPWPGQIIAANDVYQFRVHLGAGAAQGVITALRIVIDAPDIVEYLDDIVISAAGTVPPYTSPFTVIKTVTPTLQANASGAITIETNKTVNLAPVLKAYNAAHAAVSGATSDIIIKGY